MPLLSRRGHEVLQEAIVWTTVVASASSMYFIVTANRGKKATEDAEAGRFDLKQALHYRANMPLAFEGAPADQARQKSAELR